MAISQEKLCCTRITYLHTFRSSYYFLLNIFFCEKIPLISQFYHFWRETVQSMKYKKSVSQSDPGNKNKPLHVFYFSHVSVLRTHFADFSRAVCSWLNDNLTSVLSRRKYLLEKISQISAPSTKFHNLFFVSHLLVSLKAIEFSMGPSVRTNISKLNFASGGTSRTAGPGSSTLVKLSLRALHLRSPLVAGVGCGKSRVQPYNYLHDSNFSPYNAGQFFENQAMHNELLRILLCKI